MHGHQASVARRRLAQILLARLFVVLGRAALEAPCDACCALTGGRQRRRRLAFWLKAAAVDAAVVLVMLLVTVEGVLVPVGLRLSARVDGDVRVERVD